MASGELFLFLQIRLNQGGKQVVLKIAAKTDCKLDFFFIMMLWTKHIQVEMLFNFLSIYIVLQNLLISAFNKLQLCINV